MSKPIINVTNAPVYRQESGEHFAFAMSSLAQAAGARLIGTNVTRVPPGKAAFPMHHHHANEEHFFILNGTGTLRVGDQTHPVKPNDYIVNLPGGSEGAHQLVNTGTEELVYLAISTLVVPEVVGYPESGKTGVRLAMSDASEARFLLRDTDRNSVGYWEGEDGSGVVKTVSDVQEQT